jgi:hypothetical protein
MQLGTDIFNRPNQNPITGNWTTVAPVGSITGTVQILSHTATEGSTTAFALAFWNAVAFPSNQYSEMSFSSFGSSSADGPSVRSTSGGNCYATVYVNSASQLYIIKITAGSLTVLTGPVSVTFHLGDVLRLEAIGTALTAKINGVSQLSTTDSTFTSGAAGMFFSGNGAASGASQYWAGGDFTTTTSGIFFIVT